MAWGKKFIDNYGDMLVFMCITAAFGIGFIVAGLSVEELKKELVAIGITLLIGVAQLANNKSRTTKPMKGSASE